MTDGWSDFAARLDTALSGRALGARLASVLTRDAVLRNAWGQAIGPGEAELAALPLALSLDRLRLVVEDVLTFDEDAAFVRMRVLGHHVHSGLSGAPDGAPVAALIMAEARQTQGRIHDAVVIADTAALLRGRAAPGALAAPRALPLSLPRGQGGAWAQAWRTLICAAFDTGGPDLVAQYDPACRGDWPGQDPVYGPEALLAQWSALRAALPSARMRIGALAGVEAALLPPRSALRWQISGRHDGWGAFGAPSGRDVVLDGISMAEFGPEGLRREWTLYDAAALRAQITSEARQSAL